MASSSDRRADWERVEEELRRVQTLDAAERYASAVLHEINNPLEAASNLAYLLKEEADDPSKVRQYASLLEEQLEIVGGIARRTLEYHRAAGSMKSVDLVDVANAALRIHQHKIAAKELRLRKVLPDKVTITANAGELLQVLTNLLANAVDALPQKGMLSIKIRKDEEEAHLLVADNGHGISDELSSRIFEPFFTTKRNHGTGLGLAISKSIVERHHGRIKARSSVRPGKSGTVFRISLPTSRSVQAEAG